MVNFKKYDKVKIRATKWPGTITDIVTLLDGKIIHKVNLVNMGQGYIWAEEEQMEHDPR